MKVHYRVHKSPTTVPLLSHRTAVHRRLGLPYGVVALWIPHRYPVGTHLLPVLSKHGLYTLGLRLCYRYTVCQITLNHFTEIDNY